MDEILYRLWTKKNNPIGLVFYKIKLKKIIINTKVCIIYLIKIK